MITNIRRRCPARKFTGQETLFCEDYEGHKSAHYCGDQWWPNPRGLPIPQPRPRFIRGCSVIIAGLLAAVAVAAVIYWMQ